MGLRNPFRRNRARDNDEALHVMPHPWWAWGPLGLVWYGTHGHNVDAGHLNHPGDVGHHNHNIDPGAGFGGFDGGGGGGGF